MGNKGLFLKNGVLNDSSTLIILEPRSFFGLTLTLFFVSVKPWFLLKPNGLTCKRTHLDINGVASSVKHEDVGFSKLAGRYN